MEIVADLDSFQDQMQFRDNEDARDSLVDKRAIDAERKPQTPRRNSNIKKAQRIANRVQMKKRASNPKSAETHHQSNIGGHVSSFLFR